MTTQRGFTLIELLVTVAVAAILISVATPFFRDTIISSRLNTTALELADALALARSESITRNRSITFCRASSADSKVCADGNQDDLWKHWLIKQNARSTVADEADVISRGRISSLMSNIQVTTAGITNNTLRFNTDGLVRGGSTLLSAAKIIVCAPSLTTNAARIINIGAAGHIAIDKEDQCE